MDTHTGHSLQVSVYGQPGVGKTAFICQFLCHRYLGDYSPTLAGIYPKELAVGGELYQLKVEDTTIQPDTSEKIPIKDAYIVLYSITSRDSFEFARRILELVHARTVCFQPPVTLVATKADMDICRVIDRLEGHSLAMEHSTSFYELSNMQDYDHITSIFRNIVQQTIVNRQSRAVEIGSKRLPLMGTDENGTSMHTRAHRERKKSKTSFIFGRSIDYGAEENQLAGTESTTNAKSCKCRKKHSFRSMTQCLPI